MESTQRPRFFRRDRLAALAIACGLSGALIGGVVARDRTELAPSEVQAVVHSQLQALATDDAIRAFELADPEVRSQFGNAENFMTMVRNHYPMVQEPASIEFLPPDGQDGTAMQRVRLTDTAGATWMLTYVLNKQDDRQWRITACIVEPDRPPLIV